MPYEMTWEGRGVYKCFRGFVSAEEYGETMRAVLDDARVDGIRYVINDFLAVDAYQITAEQAEYLAAYNRGPSFANPNIHIAYVTTDAPIIAMVRRIAELSSFETRTFPSLAEARAWLDDKTGARPRPRVI